MISKQITRLTWYIFNKRRNPMQ